MSAKKRLREMGYRNVTVKCGDGYKGWKEYAPFDGIIVTCAPKHIPKPLLEQLAVGGRMVIPVGEKIQNLILVTKTEEGIHQEKIIPVRFVSMRGEAERHSTH
jgi:protein-L-isoaspartate(D-aspartate) O-methyltransferase